MEKKEEPVPNAGASSGAQVNDVVVIGRRRVSRPVALVASGRFCARVSGLAIRFGSHVV
jgi:hypothetical protein